MWIRQVWKQSQILWRKFSIFFFLSLAAQRLVFLKLKHSNTQFSASNQYNLNYTDSNWHNNMEFTQFTTQHMKKMCFSRCFLLLVCLSAFARCLCVCLLLRLALNVVVLLFSFHSSCLNVWGRMFGLWSLNIATHVLFHISVGSHVCE